MSLTDQWCSLALYGTPSSKYDFEAWYHYVSTWMSDTGCPPQKVGVDAPGFNRDRAILKRNADRRLATSTFSNINAIECYHLKPGGTNLTFDGDAYASLEQGPDSMCFVGISESFHRFDAALLVDVCRSMFRCFGYCYGYGFRRSVFDGPSHFAAGVTLINYANPLTQAEREEVGRWFHHLLRKKYAYVDGKLRDVFPFNVLSPAHLNFRLPSRSTLQEWIRQSPERGELKPIVDDKWAWIVSEDQVRSLSNELAASGILISSS